MFASNSSQVASSSVLGVEDVFSTYLYTGNGAQQDIKNNIQLGGLPANGTITQLTGDALTDSAPVSCGITNSGVSVNTSTKKYGTGSYYFNGTSTNRLIATSPDLRIGTGDFTVECWVYATSAANQGVFQLGNAFGSGCVFVNMYPDNQFQWGWDSSYTGGVSTWANNTWIHVALVRQSGVMKLYKDGTQIGSNNTYAGNISLGKLIVGNYYDDNSAFNGYIDDLRVSNKAVYTGNFTAPAAALPTDTLVAGSNYGGLTWIKSRPTASNNWLIDTARGALKGISSEITAAEVSYSNSVTSFGSTGFALGSNGDWNTNARNYVSWTFRKQPKFFDVVTYTGSGATQAINHNLGSTPGCIIIKNYNPGNTDWTVYHRSLGTGAYLQLNNTNASVGSTAVSAVSSTTVRVAGGSANWNSSGQSYVAYIFAHDAGGFGTAGTDNVISCGSYTGNGGTQTVNLGYEPQWLLVKRSDSTGNWALIDVMRGWVVGASTQQQIYANSSAAETGDSFFGPTATGFSANLGGTWNTSGANYIYIAIRRGPMKTPTSVTQVFTPRLHTGTASTTSVTGLNHNVDYMMAKGRNSANQSWVMHLTRLMGLRRFPGSTTNSQSFDSVGLDRNNGYNLTNDSSYEAVNGTYWGSSYVHWLWSRAPGFLDVVSYVGTGANLSVTHNLGAVPRMMIIKSDSTGPHSLYHQSRGNTKRLRFTSTGSEETSSGYWNNTTPTSTTFTVGTDAEVNTSGQRYWAYLFGEIPGISKIGTYTGNGSSQTINCGFTGGARFVLLKEVGTAYWYLFDSARGIVAGNDPYLYPSGATPDNNDGAADLVDPVSSGFIVNTVAGFNTNNNSATYIYYAIA